MENQQSNILISSIPDGFLILFKSLGLPLILSTIAFNILPTKKKNGHVLNMAIATAIIVFFITAMFVIGFVITAIFSLFYTLFAGFVVDMFLSRIVDKHVLNGLIFFFFIAEFFYLTARLVFRSGQISIGTYRKMFTGMINDAKGIFDFVVIYTATTGLVLSSVKLVAAFTWLSWIFSGVDEIIWSANTAPTIIIGFLFTLIPYLIVDTLLNVILRTVNIKKIRKIGLNNQ
ncbi:MAG: hypothetical protein KJ858_03455 [Nanoarchaeota archaeon]|nr:hypothetical protein [Nanoarchaeota archaeon]